MNIVAHLCSSGLQQRQKHERRVHWRRHVQAAVCGRRTAGVVDHAADSGWSTSGLPSIKFAADKAAQETCERRLRCTEQFPRGRRVCDCSAHR